MKALALLPALEYLALLLVLRAKQLDLRTAALYAASYWGVLVFAITELTSLGHHLDRFSVSFGWLSALIVTLAILWRSREALELPTVPPLGDVLRTSSSGILLLFAGAMVLVVGVGLTAILSPPNSWDVIDYHIARVAFWISNHSVAFFPTNDYVQLVYSVWAEYATLTLTVLYGSDRLVNLVEFSSFVGLIICVSAVARELGASTRGQLIAAIVAATLPTALLESSGAMNGVVISFWLVVTVFGVLRLDQEDYPYALIASAAAAGLTLATKGTGFAVLPGALGAALLARYRIHMPRSLVDALIFAAIVVALNAPLSVRNYELTGQFLGTGFRGGAAQMKLKVGRVSLRGTAANLVRDLALQLTLTEGATQKVEQSAIRIIRLIGADPDDPDFIWRRVYNTDGYTFALTDFSRNETLAGNPIHLLLLLGALGLCAFAPLRRREVLLYALGIVTSLILFAAMLRWQRSGVRHQLPLLVLGGPLIAVVLDTRLRPRVVLAILMLLIVTAIPFVVANEYRPLLFSSLSPQELRTRPFAGNLFTKPHDAFYFDDHHRDLVESYSEVGQLVRSTGCTNIGIDNTFEQWEYPVLASLGVAEGDLRLRYTGVRNLTTRYVNVTSSPPCAIICFACARSQAKAAYYTTVGTKTATFGNSVVLFGKIRPDPAAATVTGDSTIDEAGIAAAWQKLNQFRRQQLPLYSKLFTDELHRAKEPRDQLDARFEALDRPFYDGRRVRKLIEQLKDIPGYDHQRLAEALAEGNEAMQGFVAIETQDAELFRQHVGDNLRLSDDHHAPH